MMMPRRVRRVATAKRLSIADEPLSSSDGATSWPAATSDWLPPAAACSAPRRKFGNACLVTIACRPFALVDRCFALQPPLPPPRSARCSPPGQPDGGPAAAAPQAERLGWLGLPTLASPIHAITITTAK